MGCPEKCDLLIIISPILIAGILSTLVYFRNATISVLFRLWTWLSVVAHPSVIRSTLNHGMDTIFYNLPKSSVRKENEELLSWVATQVGKRHKAPDNFGSAWKDATLLCSLAETLSPGSCTSQSPNDALRNATAAIIIIEQKTGIISGLDAQEMVRCTRGSQKKLKRFVGRLRSFCKEDRLAPNDMQCSSECVARGLGLLFAVVGKAANFLLHIKPPTHINVVVEVRGPEGTFCSERISDRSPKHKRQPITNEGEGVKIPLEYDVMAGMISVRYTPLVSGRHKLSIIWQCQHIVGSPFTVTVDDVTDLTPSSKEGSRDCIDAQGPLSASTTTKRAPGSRKVGKTVRRKVLHHIVNVQGQDLVVKEAQELPLVLTAIGRQEPQQSLVNTPENGGQNCSFCCQTECEEVQEHDPIVAEGGVVDATVHLKNTQQDEDLNRCVEDTNGLSQVKDTNGLSQVKDTNGLNQVKNTNGLNQVNDRNALSQVKDKSFQEETDLNEQPMPTETDDHKMRSKESGTVVDNRRRFFENLCKNNENLTSRDATRSLRSSSFRKAKDFWESAVSATPQPTKEEIVSVSKTLSTTTTSGSDGDSGIHLPVVRRHRRTRSDPGLRPLKKPLSEEYSSTVFPLLFRTNPLFMAESDSTVLDDVTLSPTTLDGREFIDDEIPDYAAHCMGGGYVSFTGLLDGDRLMSRRELLMGLESQPLTSAEEEELLLPRTEKCRALGSGLYYGQVGMRNHFKVTTEGAGKGFLTVCIQGAGDHDVTEVTTSYTGHNTYEVMYEVTEPGYYIISIKWSEWNVPESPFICKVTY